MSNTLTHLSNALAGRYRLERELGQGGMATVYVAQDLRHDRKVALKVMRPELLAVIGAQRFLAEIKTTASLQHPHILPLHDSGEVRATDGDASFASGDSFVFYVMPFIEGETLRDRLNRERQIGVDDAIRLAREVASALDYAHRHGVIHRDIKPENILLHEGQAVVADFGIALAVSRLEGGTRMTETGMSLGTPHYMSPEQAMGERIIDARADVYALGCVLYEMLVGEPPFTGPTAQAVVARVLTDAPRPIRTQRRTVPLHVEAAVNKALEKLPADRFTTAAEFAAALGDMTFRTSADAAAGASESTAAGARASRVGVYAGAVVIVGLGLAAMWGWLRPSAPRETTWTYISHPAKEMAAWENSFALAPDGQSYVYSGPGEGGGQLWLKRRNELSAVPLAGTAGGVSPFFSPDGQWIAFFASGKLRKVPVAGGTPSTLADGSTAAPWGAWLPDDVIVFGGSGFSLIEVDARGGKTRELVGRVATRGAVLPVGTPDGRGILYSACTVNCGSSEVWIIERRTGKSRRLLEQGFALGFLADHLLFAADGGLFAIAFDHSRLDVRGAAVPVLENVVRASISRSGTLLYTEGGQSAESHVVWVTRIGLATPIDTAWSGGFGHVALSPDGRRIAIDIVNRQQQDVWIRTLAGGTTSRVSFKGKVNTRPAWSRDGSRIAYVSDRDSVSAIFVQGIDGSVSATHLVSALDVWEAEWSPDGQWIVYRAGTSGLSYDLFAVRTTGDTTVVPLVSTPFFERAMTISPNGRFIAYVSDESGRDEVYVRPFPNAGESRWLVSTSGGTEPRWAHNGRELFYVSPNQDLNIVDVSTAGIFTAGKPRRLFAIGAYMRDQSNHAYDISSDDQRFLMIQPSAQTVGPPVLVENWVEVLKRKLTK
jgi:eukaryotic-like serine/threonine-protein kinase